MYTWRAFRQLVMGTAVAAVLVVAGCGADTTAAEQRPAAAPTESAATLTLPPPTGTALLTFTGKVGTAGQAVILDQAAVDSLNRTELTITDPFQNKRIGYRGVWLADLVRAVGADASAQVLHITALDDYVVDIPMSDLRAGGIFLAVKYLDGSAIPVADGGPTRVVFRDGTPSGNNSEQWIWSLATVEVR
jgi:hypothetical protein